MSRKVVELTLQLDVGQVTCPGVYLCQDGNVSLTIVALDSSYQTCRLPPSFPLKFTDVFYFRKRFQELCSISRLKDVLKDEVIYCELVQWTSDNELDEPKGKILAKFLSSLEDVVFPPDMCSRDGVDLLMRPTKLFPGILAPKIEITTQIRVDETMSPDVLKIAPKHESSVFSNEYKRPLPACHTSDYHRARCTFLALEQLYKKKQNRCEPVVSRFILDEDQDEGRGTKRRLGHSKSSKSKPALPCVCDICKQYHVLFHRE